MVNMVRGSHYWPTPGGGRNLTRTTEPLASPGCYRERLHDLNKKAARSVYTRSHRDRMLRFQERERQIEELEVAKALDTEAGTHLASSPACDMADEEVILVPRPGRSNDYVYYDYSDAHDDMSSLPSPAASTVSRNVTSPAPISQASSPIPAIQFTGNNGHNCIEVDGYFYGSPHSGYSTPSTAIPSPYNKLNRGGAIAFTSLRHYDHRAPTLPNTQSRVVSHASSADMNAADETAGAASPLYRSPPPRPAVEQAPNVAPSRWSIAPQDLPKDYFGGHGLARLRPVSLTASLSRQQTATPPPHHAAAVPAPIPQPQPQPIGYRQMSIGSVYNNYPQPNGYPEAQLAAQNQGPAVLPPHTYGHQLPPLNHRVAHVDEYALTAMVHWFAGRIIDRLVYETPSKAQGIAQHRRRMSQRFDPYRILSGHSHTPNGIVIAPELLQHIFKLVNHIKDAETVVYAVYFLERLPLHDIDGTLGHEFRALLVPRHDARYTLERRLATIVMTLGLRTLQDREAHIAYNMMWEIGATEKTRFNNLILLALKDLNWDVQVRVDQWASYINQIGHALYLPTDHYGPPDVYLADEHREIVSRIFTSMWETATRVVESDVPAGQGAITSIATPPMIAPPMMATPPMSRESSTQGYGYDYDHHYTQPSAPKARDFAYTKPTPTYAPYMYPESSHHGRSYAFDYTEPSVHPARDYSSAPSQYGHDQSSTRNSRDFAFDDAYGRDYTSAPLVPDMSTAVDVSTPLEETYVTRTASQEARARRAREAYLQGQEARARQAAEAREQEARAQRENTLVVDDEFDDSHHTEPTQGEFEEIQLPTLEQAIALGRQYRREITKQMSRQELRAKRARAQWLQRTYGSKSRNMVLA